MKSDSKVVIIGGGFAGINAAKTLGNKKNVQVTLIDKCNYHLFQPLLYQVAMAGLTPAEIACPIRSQLAQYKNIEIIFGKVTHVDKEKKCVTADDNIYYFDYLIVACGATHSYFGKDKWQDFAPGMKTIEQALEIRRRILLAFEYAERETDPEKIKRFMTFVIVGGGPTGVELAGSLVEMAKYTLARDFKHIDPKQAKIILVEAGPRLLGGFSKVSSKKADHDLLEMGIDVHLNSRVIDISSEGVMLENHGMIFASTILWAAGVKPSPLSILLTDRLDGFGRVKVTQTLNLEDYQNIFVIGDQANVVGEDGQPLPGLAAVAIQEGIFAAKNVLCLIQNHKVKSFKYFDKGKMATIGRGRAIAEVFNLKLSGHFAWYIWLFIHIAYINGLHNKTLVFIRWIWSYFTFSRGSRLITQREWKID